VKIPKSGPPKRSDRKPKMKTVKRKFWEKERKISATRNIKIRLGGKKS
jgi:hypothetical protein